MKKIIVLVLFVCCSSVGKSQVVVDTAVVEYSVVDTSSNIVYKIDVIKSELDKALDKGLSTSESNKTIAYYYNLAEIALNKNYQLVFSKCSPSFKKQLISSQKLWILYKEDDSKLQIELYNESPGTMYTTMAYYRGFEIIAERCKYLESLNEYRL
jgi:uncharacterized protein YecT (DUF1311 family)